MNVLAFLTHNIGPEPDRAHALTISFKDFNTFYLVRADLRHEAGLVLVNV